MSRKKKIDDKSLTPDQICSLHGWAARPEDMPKTCCPDCLKVIVDTCLTLEQTADQVTTIPWLIAAAQNELARLFIVERKQMSETGKQVREFFEDVPVAAPAPLPAYTTRELPPFFYDPPRSLEDLKKGGPSPAGHSMVSSYLSCPERARLSAMGWRVSNNSDALLKPMNALLFGSLMHALLAFRIGAGQAGAEFLLENFEGIHPVDRLKALSCLRVYDDAWPLAQDPWQYLAVEAEVHTDIYSGVAGGQCVRTVRYDAVVRPWERVINADGHEFIQPSHGVMSLEKKTSSRGGTALAASYTLQFAVQAAIWNRNLALVEKYGPMIGVIPDVIVKTVVPSTERPGPIYISKHAQQRAVEWLRLPEKLRFPVDDEGAYPRFLHSCWGRYGVCEFVDACWEDSWGNYEQTIPGVAQQAEQVSE